jgi:two-component system chemotaxis response regulator CheB
VEALTQIVGGLPEDFNAAVLVVLHIAPLGPSVLPSILARHGNLPAVNPTDGEALVPGRIYVAPPDRHLVVTRNRARVVAGPRENGNRPAADPLFRSVARHFGPRAAGVVLSGALDDGTNGLAAIKRAGGFTVVQDPDEAAFPGMPAHAIAEVKPDAILRLAEIPSVLIDFVERMAAMSAEDQVTEEYEEYEHGEVTEPDQPPSALTCPDCGGTLWLVSDAPMRFRCRVGHAFSSESLLVGKQNAVEAALWAAIVALQERADLSKRLLQRIGPGSGRLAHRYLAEIEMIGERITVLKDLFEDLTMPVNVTAGDTDA